MFSLHIVGGVGAAVLRGRAQGVRLLPRLRAARLAARVLLRVLHGLRATGPAALAAAPALLGVRVVRLLLPYPSHDAQDRLAVFLRGARAVRALAALRPAGVRGDGAPLHGPTDHGPFLPRQLLRQPIHRRWL